MKKFYYVEVIDIGLVKYGLSYKIQKDILEKHINNSCPDTILLTEHYSVITLGRSSKKENILISKEQIEKFGIEIFEIDRGGDVTVHYPGQIIIYPIIDLERFSKDVHKFLRYLESLIIEFLGEFGINSYQKPSYTGVWVNNKKISSIGIGIKKWVSYHGLSLNINNPEINYFKFINPCGLKNIEMVSMQYLLNKKLDTNEIRKRISVFLKKKFTTARSGLQFSLQSNSQTQFPQWIKKKITYNKNIEKIDNLLLEYNLNAVCKQANCPNITECFTNNRVTFMILGNVCTRKCRFCSIGKGIPQKIDEDEPLKIANAIKYLKLKSVVITSVTRDDLSDFGAGYFAKVINEIRKMNKNINIEVLIPDFKGKEQFLKIVIDAKPDIISHNIETVKKLYPDIRPQVDYQVSLEILKTVKHYNKNIYTKSGLMLGLGETKDEVIDTMKDLKKNYCDIITLGQYLKPNNECLDVQKFITPLEFKEYENIAKYMNFIFVYSGPFVRSSSYLSSQQSEIPCFTRNEAG